MRQAMFVEKLSRGRLRCHICQWRCTISPGRLGLCRMRRNDDGQMVILNYALASSVAVDPIEKKPLFHFYPGTTVFSLGTWGCNFHCRHCQNWQISFATSEETSRQSQVILPQDAVALARRYGYAGIAWTYNEPSIWFEYTLDSAKLARENGLYTVYVTNGYLTPEALDEIGPYLDAYRVDIKGFSDKFYRDLARVPRWRGILEVTERAQKKWGMHVEVITNVIPTMNDDDEQLFAIATWVHDTLGESTPWHVTRFHPYHQLQHLPPTPIETLERAHDIGKRAGLRFVYVGNVTEHPYENTYCHFCGKLAIQRHGYQTKLVGLEGSRCHHCGADLNIKTQAWRRQWDQSPLSPPGR